MTSSLDSFSISVVIIILVIGYPNLFLRLRFQSLPLTNNNRTSGFRILRLRYSDSQLSYYNQSDRSPNQRLVSTANMAGGSGDNDKKPTSNIPDYDENERFKNSSRPPDSHYSPEEKSEPSSPSPSPPPEEHPPQRSPKSRIPDYDEYARFKDSSRPPDSHYPAGPGPKYRKRSSSDHHARTNIKLVMCGLIVSLSSFYKY